MTGKGRIALRENPWQRNSPAKTRVSRKSMSAASALAETDGEPIGRQYKRQGRIFAGQECRAATTGASRQATSERKVPWRESDDQTAPATSTQESRAPGEQTGSRHTEHRSA